jgi:hypothetical protein
MADYKLSSPHLRILRGSLDAPEIIDVQCLNPDLILWDRTRLRHKWPEVKDAPIMWLTFLGWAACRREGRIPPDLRYEEWEATTLDVKPLGEDDGEDNGDVSPTLPGLEPG